MPHPALDILMITHRRPDYVRLTLPSLLDTCDETMRVWLWHNGDDAETLDVVRGQRHHPRVHAVHHSPENVGLREPTNWLYREAKGPYLAKVDDDCLLPAGWADALRAAHEDEPRLGIVGCWRFQAEDFVPALAERKIEAVAGGHRILRNCWVEGSGYVMKRACVERCGPIRRKESFTQYGVRVARAGFVNGWRYPFIAQEHLDDPRAPHSPLRTDADLRAHLPLSARHRGTTTLEAWVDQLRRSARVVQSASPDPRRYTGLRKKLRRAWTRLRRDELLN